MPYIGSPFPQPNSYPSDIILLDDISSGFDGTTTQFNLTQSSATFRNISAVSLFVKLGGITQTPNTDYIVSLSAGNSVIIFTTAPSSGLSCEIRSVMAIRSDDYVGLDKVTRTSINISETSDPVNDVSEGDIYYNNTEKELRFYNGTEWDSAGAGASKVYSKTVFGYQNVISSNITISAPYNTAVIWTHEDVTVDIESGVQIDVDDDCVLLIADV